MSEVGFPEDTSSLDAWASAEAPGYAGPSTARKFPTGQSNPTYLITTPAARYVRIPRCVAMAYARPQNRTFREDQGNASS